uniref:Methyltransferase domain-containing protein n=1 Tax=Trypanosoma vivax (strain Y486) TaxID=1055687 RepID=G0U371_TRYVY|nr:conserved hypothetical protein [Trypanosoma vivax Y486]
MTNSVDRSAGKRPRERPFVEDYRPYTGGQLACIMRRESPHESHWNMYYRNNGMNGYRDRHYILREFSEFREALKKLENEGEGGDVVWMEVGCGVGNAIFPILEEYGHVDGWRVVAFDISSVAISLLQQKQNSLPCIQRDKLYALV